MRRAPASWRESSGNSAANAKAIVWREPSSRNEFIFHRRIESTRRLAALIERLAPQKRLRIHPATRAFQALRIAVNDELGQLRGGLDSAWAVLKPGGRFLVITFHSLEDRIVKEFGRKLARDYSVEGTEDIPELRRPKRPEMAWVTRKAVQPKDEETKANPRARSAQLRVMQKL